ncbi:MAG: alpha/beta fold hydrolase [Armatimonadetes bacterium]|nr:alpha/beta fold hydrolase [Armatimonadota bacterium]
MTRTMQIAAGAGLTLVGLAGANAVVRSRAGGLPETLDTGERLCYPWRHGRISYQMAGQGDPLLLIHGIYAGACNFEWRRNFEALSHHFRVFAPDLLGFGHSDRPALTYTDDLYVDLIHDFARDVLDGPAFAIASSLSSGFLVADAAANPSAYHSLVLVVPPALQAGGEEPGLAGRAMHSLLRAPVVGTALYNLMMSRPNIEAELNKVYERRDAFDADTVRFYQRSTHQAGARWAASSFIGGYLSRNIRGEFRSLQMPVLLVWGDDAAYSPVGNAAAYLTANPSAELKVFEECGNLPHDEYPEMFNRLVTERFRAMVMA